MLKQIKYKIKGMQQNLVASSFNSEYSFENINMRLSPSKDNTLLGITNEKGTKHTGITIKGIPIGIAIIKNQLVLFSTIDNSLQKEKDFITKITFEGEANTVEELYSGNLNFNSEYPIETLVSYESEGIQKVYWTDTKNQLRFINIANGKIEDGTTFDFIRDISSSLDFSVNIKKIQSGLGTFPSGVIQYFITGYNKKGQESNILYYSPLYYISPESRGGTAEEKCTNSFVINIGLNDSIISQWTNIRVYSIQRTSLNATVAAYLVADMDITKNITIQDNGIGEALADTDILFKTRSPLFVGTLSQKMQTLFVGNITYKTIPAENEKELQKKIKEYILIKETTKKVPYYSPEGVYPYKNNLDKSSNIIKHFKGGEKYRLGIQLMDKYGVWSNPLYIADFETVNYPEIIEKNGTNNYFLNLPIITYLWNEVNINGDSSNKLFAILKERGFIAYRALRAVPITNKKSILCQGVLSQTVYRIDNRLNDSIYSQSSWFFRPIQQEDFANMGLEYFHNNEIGLPNSIRGEIQCSSHSTPFVRAYTEGLLSVSYICKFYYEKTLLKYTCVVEDKSGNIIDKVTAGSYTDVISYIQKKYIGTSTSVDITKDIWKNYTSYSTAYSITFDNRFNINTFAENNKYNYIVDNNFLTLHSPDINDNSYNNINETELSLRIVGVIPITANITSYDIQYTGSTRKPYSEGSITRNYNHDNISNKAYGLISGGLFIDESKDEVLRCFAVYPWHRNGSLGDQGSLKLEKDEAKIATLSKKVFSNLRYSYNTIYFKNNLDTEAYFENDKLTIETTEPKNNIWNASNNSKISIFNSNEDTLIKVYSDNKNYWYKGNIDTILSPKIEKEGNDIKGYDIYISEENYNIDNNLLQTYTKLNDDKTGTEPVSIKYKSTQHAVVKLGTKNDIDIVLPSLQINDNNSILTNYFTVNTKSNGVLGKDFKNYTGLISNKCTDKDIDKYIHEGNINKYILVENTTAIPLETRRLIKITKSDSGIGYEGVTCYSYDKWIYLEEPAKASYWYPNNQGFAYTTWTEVQINSYYNDSIELNLNDNILSKNCLTDNSGILYLAELYNPNSTFDSIYGEIYNEYETPNISWVPASDICYLNDTWEYDDYILNLEGDTYFSRWDCLKTYPFTQDDQNKVVEILSFMVESQINLDGRTDRNRGATNNNYMSPTNFNSFNEVYNQDNNYFTYRFVKNETNKLANTVAWSTVKNNTSDIDNWTKINSTNSIDISNLYGEIQRLYSINNQLYFFQDKAIGKLRYNENAIITTDQGVPIELGNTGTLTGYTYLSTSIGLPDKWSICDGNNIIYFTDINSLGIYRLYNDEIENLAVKKGFISWLDKNKSIGWNPKNFNGFVLYYNNIDKELYIISKDYCLAYSDILGEFSSFYSYENNPYYCNIDTNKLFINYIKEGPIIETNIWKQHEGSYNRFFNQSKDSSITILANPEPTLDKIFNTIEFRADVLDENNKALDIKPFNKLNIWNEYQDSGDINLNWVTHGISNLKKKFRVWRVNNFRDSNGINRVRNPWTFFKLTNKNVSENKTILHDIVLNYFV